MRVRGAMLDRSRVAARSDTSMPTPSRGHGTRASLPVLSCPLLLLVEIGCLAPLSGVRFDSWEAFSARRSAGTPTIS